MILDSVVMMFLLAAPARPAPAADAPLTWKVTGSDVTFEMSAKDLRALRGGKEVFGLRSREKKFLSNFEPDREAGEDPPDMSDWEGDESYDVLSVVGPWVSYETSSSGYTGGAHPYAYTIYATTDVTKGPDGFSLLSVFPEKEVLAALKADRFVKKHISDPKAFKQAGTVEDLLQSLEPGEDCVGFQDGIEQVQRSVAFHHLEGNKVAVRIAFSYASEACRGNKFVLGLLLPIPAALKPALERAAKREEGFLMKDAKAVHAPSVNFTWAPPPQKKP